MFPFGSRHLVIALALLVGTTGIVVATERSGGDDQAALAPAADPSTSGVEPMGDSTAPTTGPATTAFRLPTTTVTGRPPVAASSAAATVDIWPGDDVNAVLAGNPVGTSFLLHAGVYSQLTLMPRSGQVITGEPGTILDGGGVTADGVGRAVANDITIRGLTIRNYTNACVNWGADGWGRRWTIEDVDAGYCKLGVKVKKGGIYRDNYIHHNLQYGMEGTGEFDLVIEGNEIAFNRTDTSWDPGDSGATKFHSTVGMVVRDNYVHDNNGIGIWLDGSNTDAVIEGNLVVDNDQAGIVAELGYSPVIRNNTVEGNGFASDGLGGEGAGILAFSVRDADIYGNVVTGNRNGIAGRSDDRGVDSDTGEEWLLEDLYVHDNLITMDEGATGIWDYLPGEPALKPAAGIRFEGNIYTLTPSSGRFLRWTDAIAGNGAWDLFTLTGWRAHFPLDGYHLCDGQISTVVGSAGSDDLVGKAGKDVITGLGGNDRIEGLGGNDVICGGDGGDTLLAGAGKDVVIGATGADTLRMGNGADTALGGAGEDTLVGGAGLDSMWGGIGGDVLQGGIGKDSLFGGAGTDICNGGAGTDQATSCETKTSVP